MSDECLIIWSRLFCIRRNQSPHSATRFALSRTSVRSMQTSSPGRNEPRNNPQLCSRWIHSQSVGSVSVSRPGTRANWRVSPARGGRTGHVLFVRENTLMAAPFDATSAQVSGDVFPVAEDVFLTTNNSYAAASVSESDAKSTPGPCSSLKKR